MESLIRVVVIYTLYVVGFAESEQGLFPSVTLENVGTPQQTVIQNVFIYDWPLEHQTRYPGRVTALEYCYENTHIAQTESIFTLRLLQRVNNGFRIIKTVEVTGQRASSRHCTNRVIQTCCNREPLESSQQFSVSSESTITAFAISTGRLIGGILGYYQGQERTTQGFHVHINSINPNGEINVHSSLRTTIFYRMFNFIIDLQDNSATTAIPTTNAIQTTNAVPTTNTVPTTNAVPTTTAISTTNAIPTTTTTSTTNAVPTTTATSTTNAVSTTTVMPEIVLPTIDAEIFIEVAARSQEPLSSQAMVGIVLGCVILMVLLFAVVLAIVLYCRVAQRKKKFAVEEQQSVEEQQNSNADHDSRGSNELVSLPDGVSEPNPPVYYSTVFNEGGQTEDDGVYELISIRDNELTNFDHSPAYGHSRSASSGQMTTSTELLLKT